MGYLSGKRAYLSGPIEFSPVGTNWRIEPKKALEKYNLDIFDPFEDPKQNLAGEIMLAREKKDFETMQRIAKGFVKKDLGMLDRSDILISFTPYKVATVGTCHEIINSSNSKKPTILICPEGREKIALWYWGFINPEFMFGSWQDLYSYLDEVDAGLHKHNDRWAFVYGLL